MIHTVLRAGLSGLAFFSMFTVQAGVVLEDDAGQVFRFEKPAERIITLAPHLAELVFMAGAGETLVGTVEWSDHPPAAKAVPRIGDSFRIDVERVIALQPDAVLAWGGGTPQHTIDRLRELGLPVAVLAPEDLASIPVQLEWVGKLTGNEQATARKAEAFRHGLRQLRETFADEDVLRVFYQISGQPLFTIGKGHTITELIEICGGENIFSDLDARAHSVSREAVITRNPDVIVAGRYAGSGGELSDWRRWENLAATRQGNLFSIDAERIARPTPGILEGGRELCEALERARENIKSNARN
ncbi:MAG TPA: cobalamin-binding protein [Gammaproteobacteria bacterium]